MNHQFFNKKQQICVPVQFVQMFSNVLFFHVQSFRVSRAWISSNPGGRGPRPPRSNLVADLYKNLSAAQLKSNDFAAALASADEALKVRKVYGNLREVNDVLMMMMMMMMIFTS